jgi:hypothetical protein
MTDEMTDEPAEPLEPTDPPDDIGALLDDDAQVGADSGSGTADTNSVERPSEETIAQWRADPSSIPKQYWPWARDNLGFRGALGRFIGGPTQPMPKEHQNDQQMIERVCTEEGLQISGLTMISRSYTPGEPITGDGRQTRVYFSIDQNGNPIDRRQPFFLRVDQYPVAVVCVTIEQKLFRENIAMIEVWDTYKRRCAAAKSQTGEDGRGSTTSPATAVRQALRQMTDGNGNFVFKRPLPIVMEGRLTTPPPAEPPDQQPVQPRAADPVGVVAASAPELVEQPAPKRLGGRFSGWSTTKKRVVGLAGTGLAAGGIALGACVGPTPDEVNDRALDEMLQEADDDGDAVSCVDRGGAWVADVGACDFGEAEPEPEPEIVAPPETDAPPEPGDGAVTDRAASGDACTAGGGVFDEVIGGCTYEPPHGAALGYRTLEPPIVDPAGGQSTSAGEDEEPWTFSSDTDIVSFHGATVRYEGESFLQYFGGTSFPCGAVTDEYRVHCPVGAAELSPGEFVVASMTLAGPIDSTGERLQYGLAFDGGGEENYLGRPPFERDLFNDTELWYRLAIGPDGERVVYADGFRDDVAGFPRHSSALVVEFDDTIVFVIPRDELPGDLAYRLTAFRNEGSPLDAPQAATSGGDVSGFDVSQLETVPNDVVVAVLGPATPPDTPGGQERLPAPTDDGESLLVAALVDHLQQRWNAAFATADVDSVIGVFHPISVLGSVDGCQAFVERIFPGAQQIDLVWTPADAAVAGGIVTYSVDVSVTYPTGVTQYPIPVAIGLNGQLAPVFTCDT